MGWQEKSKVLREKYLDSSKTFVGKRIKYFGGDGDAEDWEDDEEVLIVFDDGTFTILMAHSGYGGSSPELRVEPEFSKYNIGLLVNAGLVTREEQKEYQDLENSVREYIKERQERELFVKLSKKYGTVAQ